VLSSNGASNAMSRDTSSAGLARSRGPSTAPGCASILYLSSWSFEA
jgi:hypothetical protein